MKHTMIRIRFQFEGIHNWPDAPPEVWFLREPHRHMFKVEALMTVGHDDRELEFFMVQKRLLEFSKTLYKDGINLGRMSCEQMADRFVDFIAVKWKRDFVQVEVSEDGENSAIVRWSVT